MERLKPCPFCGSEAEINGRDRLHYWFIQCVECGATQYGKETKEEAVDAWNRRGGEKRVMSVCTGDKTNADCIRAMTNEELADFITRQRFSAVNPIADKLGIDVTSLFLTGCKNTLDWLKQKAKRSEE